MNRPKLNRLSQDVVNKIAAGEVVERPSSVVKELVDNAIDAQATKIHIKIKNGGIDLVEVIDNGYGIPLENLGSIFDAHTTSKIQKIEDLNNLLSMGFRGEALSTITSVAKVSLTSRFSEEEFGNEIRYDEKGKSEIKKSAKEQGTTIKVENLFYNIPARKKYLKTPQTEYRKIYELLCKFFLIYPNIHFLLEKDGKIIEDLHKVKNAGAGEITEERVKEILGEGQFLKLFFDGNGINISGYIAHPSSHKSNLSHSYVFLNNRGIVDRGIVRAVYEGYSRYLPFGQKIDFVLNIKVDPQFVDVNVHPRKEEVRFENPFRIYSAIEDAVRHILEKELSFENTHSTNLNTDISESLSTNKFAQMRKHFHPSSSGQALDYQSNNIYTKNKGSSSVQDTLLFSKELLAENLPFEQQTSSDIFSREDSQIVNIFQIFTKYIVVEYANATLWIVDQHAAAERINFEKLSKKDTLDIQSYLVPLEVTLKKEEILFLEEYEEFFQELGITYELKDKKIFLKSVPAGFSDSDFDSTFQEIFSLEQDISLLKKNFTKLREDILATIACHSSIRSGQRLPRETMLDLLKQLSKCQNPYSCPHGRPAVWKMTLTEIDSNFERTY